MSLLCPDQAVDNQLRWRFTVDVISRDSIR